LNSYINRDGVNCVLLFVSGLCVGPLLFSGHEFAAKQSTKRYPYRLGFITAMYFLYEKMMSLVFFALAGVRRHSSGECCKGRSGRMQAVDMSLPQVREPPNAKKHANLPF
jgi:hypothetical protein